MPLIPSYVRLRGCFGNFSNKRTSFLPWKEYFLVNGSVEHYSECSLHLWAGISFLRHSQWSLDAHKGWKDHSLGRKCSTPLPLPRVTQQKIQHLAHPQVLTVLQIGWTAMTMVQRQLCHLSLWISSVNACLVDPSTCLTHLEGTEGHISESQDSSASKSAQ